MEEVKEELEVQTTVNEDTLENLIDPEDCVIENLEKEDGE